MTATTIDDLGTQGRIKAILIFNKASGAYMHAVSWVDPMTLGGQDIFTFVEDEIDLLNDTVVGIYPDYTIQAAGEGPQKIYESQLNARVAYKITKRYSVTKQINVLGKLLTALAERAGFDPEAEDDPTGYGELLEMLDYIDQVKQANAAARAEYINSPDYIYISNADLEAELAERSAGGAHEFTGSREIEGGIVFD